MDRYEIGKGVDLDFGATQPATVHEMNPGSEGQPNATPLPIAFNAGASAIAVLSVAGWTQAEQNGCVMELQGSDNEFSGWETLTDENGDNVVAGGTGDSPVTMYRITIPEFMRLRNTSVTAGDGYGSAYLLSN